MLEPHPNLTTDVIRGLGWLYLVLFVLNVGWTVRSFHRGKWFNFAGFEHLPTATLWAIYSAGLLLLAATHLGGGSDPESFPFRLPEWAKNGVDTVIANPISYFAMSILLFLLMIWLREWLVKPTVGWILFNLSVLFLAISMTDYDFRQIVGKPDNVPIVGMLYLVGGFTWLYFYRACENDRRIEQGRSLLEQEQSQQVLVWPDLVYTEMICMIVLTVVLILWGVALPAPLEEPASAVKTPNPSKAPWYFLGLQEMLVYYDPWMAGVVLPTIIIIGLMAIPYIDFNKRGNGYYSFKERRFSVITFLFGFLPLWVAMIILGTFIRGPNWNMFGPYEYWDVHKLANLNNVNLSDYFWVDWLKEPLPRPAADATAGEKFLVILKREWLGFALVIGYFMFMPPLMATTVFRRFFVKMGFLRYMTLAMLLLFMAALPLKMGVRWAFNLKYIIAIPEWFFNI
jgi:hypothetical protein